MARSATATVRRALAGGAAWALAGAAQAVQPYNMPVGATEISREVYSLHMIIFWICVAIGVVVFGAMFYSILKHRKSKGHEPARFHESTTVEIVWTVIPFAILIFMAVPAAKTLIEMYDTSDAEMTVKITGYQWKWKYDYVDEGISFYSSLSTPAEQIYAGAPKSDAYLLEVDNELVVPVGRKIRFLITADDVIHAWWVPELALKKDAIPGFINDFWVKIDQPGVYRGQCAELCGRYHGFMPVVVRAVEPAEYEQWIAGQKAKSMADAGAAAPEAG
jgi:cytochrome c oxidase subunit 2